MKNKDKSILFSVLIANYNNGVYIKEAIESVLRQSHSNWEIILVDDASSDNSWEILQAYKDHSQIFLYRNDINKGCGYTKAKCIEFANGEICGFLDGDDEILESALEMMIDAHKKLPQASLIYSQSYLCDENLNKIKINEKIGAIPVGLTYLDSLFGSPLVNHFATFKSKFYNKTSGIKKTLQRAVDQDLYYKLEEVGDLCFIESPLYLYRYFRNEGNDGISTGPNLRLAKTDYFKVIHETIKRRGVSNVKNRTINNYKKAVNDFFIYEIKSTKSLRKKISAFVKSIKYGGFTDRLNYRLGLLLK